MGRRRKKSSIGKLLYAVVTGKKGKKKSSGGFGK